MATFNPIIIEREKSDKPKKSEAQVKKEIEKRGRELMKQYGCNRLSLVWTEQESKKKKGNKYPILFLKGTSKVAVCYGKFSTQPAWDRVNQYPKNL